MCYHTARTTDGRVFSVAHGSFITHHYKGTPRLGLQLACSLPFPISKLPRPSLLSLLRGTILLIMMDLFAIDFVLIVSY